MINLENLNIILTGATGGIGSAILDKLYNCNAKVIATGTNEEKLENIKKKFESVITKKFDISKHESIENFINEKISQKRIDTIFCITIHFKEKLPKILSENKNMIISNNMFLREKNIIK